MSVHESERSAPRGLVFLRALRAAVGRFPLWFLTWLAPLLLALVLVAPWMAWFGRTLPHAYEPHEVLGSLDVVFRTDHADALEALRSGGGSAAAMLAVLAMLAGVFFAGGWLQVFLERTSGHSVRRFLWGGAKYFWRFLRVWVLTVLTIIVFGWIVYGWPWNTMLELLLGASSREDLEVVESEWTAAWAVWLQDGTFAFLFALTMTWGDYTRTRLALHDGRSGLWAGLCTWFLLLAHPIRTLRPHAFLFGLELLVVFALGRWSWSVNSGLDAASTWRSVLLLFGIGQLGMLWQALTRAARYAAAVQISRFLVAPLTQPDRWASRIGGPGGPQYPIDDTDDYGVSI